MTTARNLKRWKSSNNFKDLMSVIYDYHNVEDWCWTDWNNFGHVSWFFDISEMEHRPVVEAMVTYLIDREWVTEIETKKTICSFQAVIDNLN